MTALRQPNRFEGQAAGVALPAAAAGAAGGDRVPRLVARMNSICSTTRCRRRRTTAGPVGCRRDASSGCTAPIARSRPWPEDHANCSVGSYTHGFVSMADAATRGDVARARRGGLGHARGDFPTIPAVEATRARSPTGRSPRRRHGDVVLRAAARGRADDAAATRGRTCVIEGKPQCHIVAIAKEQGRLAASVGCALSAGPAPACGAAEATCRACPVARARRARRPRLESRRASRTRPVARYAGADAARFAVRDHDHRDQRPVGPQPRLAALPAPQGDDARQLGPGRASARALGQHAAIRRCCAGTASTSSTRPTRSR